MTVELNYNDNKKHGIELLFSEELSKAETTRLKELGFKQGFHDDLKWYAAQHPAFITYAEELQEVLSKGGDLKNIRIQASFVPSLKNIDEKNFSHVSILFKAVKTVKTTNAVKEDQEENYIVFDSYKTIAAAIATRFGVNKYKDAFRGVKVYPRNYKRKARALLRQGKVITASENKLIIKEGAKGFVKEEESISNSSLKSTQAQNPTKTSIKEVLQKDEMIVSPSSSSSSSSSSSQHLLNKEIEDFIIQRDKENHRYTPEDQSYLLKYTGSGGLINQGAEGKGILYEYFTPDAIVQKMWGLAIKYGYEEGTVLEPACGIGNFIKYAPDAAKVTGYEINPTSKRIAEILYPNATIYGTSFESLFFAGYVHLKDNFKNPEYRLVIGNPPYGDFSGKWAGMGEKKWTGASEYDQYFMTRGIDLLAKDGLLVFIIPSSFLQNASKYNNLKEKISAKADLVDAYRLPQRAFKTTDIGTDIIVFRKK